MNHENQLQDLPDYSMQSISKKEIRFKALQDAEQLLNSEQDCTPVYVQAQRISEYLMNFCSQLKERVTDEISLYSPREPVKIFGASVSVIEAGVRYDFSRCNDPEWSRLKEEAESAMLALKEREQLLKSLKAPLENQLHPETGEIYTVYPPLKTSSTVPKVSY